MNLVKWMVRIGLLAAIALFLSACDSGSDEEMDTMMAEKDAEIARGCRGTDG